MTDAPAADLCNCFAIRRAARHVTQLYDRQLASAGLKVTQFAILARLRAGPKTINELAAAMAMDRTTMGRNVRPLERDGLVSVSPDPADARRKPLSITDAGTERFRAGRAGWADAQRRFDAAYGPDRARELRAVLAGVTATDFNTQA